MIDKLDRVKLFEDNLPGYVIMAVGNLFFLLIFGPLIIAFFYLIWFLVIPLIFIFEFILWYYIIPHTIVALDKKKASH